MGMSSAIFSQKSSRKKYKFDLKKRENRLSYFCARDSLFYLIKHFSSMRSHGKHTDKFPDTEEVRRSIDENEDPSAMDKINKIMQDINP